MIIEYDVHCFERTLQITFPEGYEWAEGEILRLLDDAYCEWHDLENIQDPEELKIIQDSCLEEHMMFRLSKKYNQWTEWDSVYYGDDEEEM